MIYVLIGKSCTGKSVIARRLKRQYMLSPIITYTTRPKRDREVDGEEYHFINEEQLSIYKKNGKVIEERSYCTASNLGSPFVHSTITQWYYATIDDGELYSQSLHRIIIGTIESYLTLVHHFGSDKVIPIYIYADDDIRMKRMERRESRQKNPNYKEMYRRFLADNKDYSMENICSANLKYRVANNDNLDACVKKVFKIILKNS